MTYNWTFTTLHYYVESEGQNKVVYQVQFKLRGDNGSHTGSVGGTVACTYEEGDPFIEFDDLQQSDVEGWTTTKLGAVEVAILKERIDSQIIEKAAPTRVSSTTMPWNN
jgi:hypothetical protein|tara:strand:+ start:35 stop:361 length:327 start_codon:yes stop_codon:yes gene_type:complete